MYEAGRSGRRVASYAGDDAEPGANAAADVGRRNARRRDGPIADGQGFNELFRVSGPGV